MPNAETSKKRIALVTGGNRGIGLETCRQLAASGVKVLLGTRDPAKGRQAAEELRSQDLDVDPIVISVDDFESHQSAYFEIERNFGRLDILVNNAGIFIDEHEGSSFVPASKTSMEVLRKTFETNFFGVVALTQKMLPLIRTSDEGRIVFVSSLLGSLTLHSDPAWSSYEYKPTAYDTSKSALNAYAIHLAFELRNTPILVNVAHPGSVVTDMNPGGSLPIEKGAKTSVALALLPKGGPTGRFFYLGNEQPW